MEATPDGYNVSNELMIYLIGRRTAPPVFLNWMSVFGVKQPEPASHLTTTAPTSSTASARTGWTLTANRCISAGTVPPKPTVRPVWRSLAAGGAVISTIPKSESVWMGGFLVGCSHMIFMSFNCVHQVYFGDIDNFCL